jgi:hypothetical protein
VILRGASVLLALILCSACGADGRAAASPSSVSRPSATPLIDVYDMMGAFPPTTFLVVTPGGVKGIALLNHALKYTIPTEGNDVQVAADDQGGRVYVLDGPTVCDVGGCNVVARLRWFDAASGAERASAKLSGATPARARTSHGGLAIDAASGLIYALLRRADGIAVERFDWFSLRSGGTVWAQFRCGDLLAAAGGRVVVACMDEGGLVVKEGESDEFKDSARRGLVALALAPDGTMLAVGADGILMRLPRRPMAETLTAIRAHGTALDTITGLTTHGPIPVPDGIAAVANCCFYVSVLDDVGKPQVRTVSGLSDITLIAFPRSAPPVGGVIVKPPFAYYVVGSQARHIDVAQGFGEVMADVGAGALPGAVVFR